MAILTVSRELGCMGKKLGNSVAEALGYRLVDKESILADMRLMGHRWEEWAKELDEACPSIWEKYDWSFRGFGALVQSIILSHAVEGKTVVMGRGGNLLFKDIPFAFRVRAFAPLEWRIDRIMHDASLSQDAARWLVEKTDRERAAFVLSLYGKRWDDPADYDCVLNMADRPFEEILAFVRASLEERERQITPEALRVLSMHAEAARIKAGLMTNPALFIPTLEVVFDGVQFCVRGVVHNPGERKRVEAEARRYSGELPLRCELHYRT